MTGGSPRLERAAPRWRDHAFLIPLLVLGSLLVRSVFAYREVFLSEYVRFRGTDSWYHLRLIENLLAHFPRPIDFDPYLRHPGGAEVAEAPLFDFTVALGAWIAGAGRPSAALVEALAAWFPAILGALVIVPVYLTAHWLWGRPAGLVAGALLATLPGRFLERSMLGAADHHVMEVFWSSLCLFLIVVAVQAAESPKAPGPGSVPGSFLRLAPIGYAAGAGVALTAYLLSWRSASVFPVLLAVWALAQAVLGRVQAPPTRGAGWILAPALAASLVVLLPWVDGIRVPERHVVGLVLALAVTGIAIGVGVVRRAGARAPWLLGLPVALAVAVTLSGTDTILPLLRRLRPTAWGLTVAEMRPLYVDDSVVGALWREFGPAAVTAGLGLVVLAWSFARARDAASSLLLVWCLALVAASLAQRRFTYYLAVGVALLSARAIVFALAGWQSMRGARTPASRRSMEGAWLLAVGLAGMLLPNVGRAVEQARQPSGPDPAWHRAARWLESETPEPFLDPDYYLARYPAARLGGAREAAYGVLAWWDRGFWLTRLARRPPVANPKGHGIETAASFFLASGEAEASRWLAEAGAGYVVVDEAMPVRQVGGSDLGLGTLHSMAVWLGRPLSQFVERYEVRSPDGSWQPLFLYYPEYFRTMAVRLQTFSGLEIQPRDSLWVVSFQPHRRADGVTVKRIDQLRSFTSYRDAMAELGDRPDGSRRLVSSDPAASCVPLAALTSLKRVYPTGGVGSPPPPVQIFEVSTTSSRDRP